MRLVPALLAGVVAAPAPAADTPVRLAHWNLAPSGWTGSAVRDATATLTADRWAYLLAAAGAADVEVSATLTVREPGRHKSFSGQNWSVWPDKTFGDQGWDAAHLLRAGDGSGYQVQVSATLGEVALVTYTAGGYVRSVPLALDKGARCRSRPASGPTGSRSLLTGWR
jgi:hypothetical protein